MNHASSDILSTLHQECYFQKRPEPLLELLYDLGVFGRAAEVFWTYHQFALQSGTWTCQVSSAYIAARLRTDVRTVQRANDKLISLGLIRRQRATRTCYSSADAEAPAITEITIPDDKTRSLLADAPRRPTAGDQSTPTEVLPAAPESTPHSDAPPSPAPLFTAVNNRGADDSETPSQRRATPRISATSSVEEAKCRLPDTLRTIFERSFIRGSVSTFEVALQDYPGVPDSDAAALTAALTQISVARDSGLKEARNGGSQNGTRQLTSSMRSPARKKLPYHARKVPEKVVAYIRSRLSRYDAEGLCENSDRTFAEILYSIAIGTLRGTDLMRGVNAALKLIRQDRWSKPRGMPDGWQWDRVVS